MRRFVFCWYWLPAAFLPLCWAGPITAQQKLLEEGDYTRHSKATRELRTAISVVYWLVVTAAFLLYTFGPKGNGQPQYSWFIWAIGGILYAALVLVVKMALRKQNNK